MATTSRATCSYPSPTARLGVLLGVLGLYTTVDKEGDVYKFTPKDGKQEFYGKRHGKWAVFSDKSATLDSAADEPAELLAGANNQYLVTGRIFLANVPEKFQQMLIGKIEEGAKNDLDSKSDEASALHAARAKASAAVVAGVKSAIQGIDQVTWGWGLDRTAEKLFAEVNLTAKVGTPLAKQMASLENATSKFAGMDLPGQAISAHAAAPITELKAGVLNSIISLGRQQAPADSEKQNPPEKQELAKGLINNVAELSTGFWAVRRLVTRWPWKSCGAVAG